MKVDTYLFGQVDVDPGKVINFPGGIVGFENSRRFMLAHEVDKGDPVSFTLQSLDDPNLAIQIIDASALGFNYELALSDEELTLLKSPVQDEVAVMLVLSKAKEGGEGGIRANVRAPILINTKAQVGLQKVLVRMRQNITLSNLVNPV